MYQHSRDALDGPQRIDTENTYSSRAGFRRLTCKPRVLLQITRHPTNTRPWRTLDRDEDANNVICDEKYVLKHKMTVIFAAIDCAPDECTSEMGSDSAKNGHTQRSKFTTIRTSLQLTKEANASEIWKSRSTPPGGPYSMSVQGKDGPYDVALFFGKVTYRIMITVGTLSHPILTGTSLVSTGACTNLIINGIPAPRLERGEWGN